MNNLGKNLGEGGGKYCIKSCCEFYSFTATNKIFIIIIIKHAFSTGGNLNFFKLCQAMKDASYLS